MTKDPRLAKVGRIALRVEGKNWNAYYALPDTMAGAIFLGSIRMRLVEGDPRARDMFIHLMRHVVGRIVPELAKGKWRTDPAPEHERTKE